MQVIVIKLTIFTIPEYCVLTPVDCTASFLLLINDFKDKSHTHSAPAASQAR